MWRLLFVVVAFAVAAGCSGDVAVEQQQLSIEQSTVTASPSTAIADGVSAARILVTARDTEGKAMANQTVTLALTGEQNALSAETATTNGEGVAEFQLTSTLAEKKRVTATIGDVALAPITATFIAGPPAKFDFVAPPSDTTAGAIMNPAVQLKLLDAQGNTVNLQAFEVVLTLGGNSTGARLRGTTAATTVGGTVTFQNLSVDKTGEYTLVASTLGVDGQSSAPFSIRPASPIKLAFTSEPVDPGAGVPLAPPLTVAVRDVFDNVVDTDTRDVTIAIASGPPGRSIAGTLTVPAVGGVATFSDLVLKTSGVYSLTATAAGIIKDTSKSFTVAPAVPTRVLFKVQPAGSSAGVTLNSMEAIVHDSVGNIVADYSGDATIAVATGPTGATLSGTTSVTFDKGIARFSTLKLDKTGDYTLTVTSGTLTAAISNSFKIGPAAPKKLAFAVEPSNALAGEPNAPAIRVSIRDEFDNVVTTASYLVSLNIATGPAGAVLSGSRAAAAIGGEAVFSNIRLTRAGSYTLTANAGTLTSGTSAPFTIAPGAATKLAFAVEPTAITAGQPITPAMQVLVQDSFGNTIPGYTGDVTLGIAFGTGGASLSGTTTVAAVAGVANFPGISVDKSGDFTLAATAAGLSAATSAPFTVGPATPTRLAFTVQPRDATAGQLINPAVQVFLQDDFGNTVPSATDTVTLAITTGPSGATLLGTSSVAAVGGIATFSDLKIETSGTYALGATAGTLSAATSDTFNIRPAAPAKLKFDVEPAAVVAGEQIAPSVQVAIQDTFGNVVESATNRIALTLSGGTPGAVLTGGSGTDAVAGVATFSTLSLDKTGSYTLVASSGVLTPATSASFDVSAAVADRVVFQVQPGSSTAGVTLAPAITVLVQDRFGNVRASSTDDVTLAIASGPAGGTLLGTTTVAAAAGVATFADLALQKAGDYTLTATSGGLRAATGSPFTVAPAAAAKLAYRAEPAGTQAGRLLNPVVTVEVQDAFGNLVPSSSADVTVAIGTGPGGAALQGTGTVAASSGVARFPNLALRTAGAYTLTASAGTLTAVTSGSFTITHADPSELVITAPPTNAGAGAIIAPAIEVAVQDQYGNVATSSNNLVRASIASGPQGAVLTGTAALSPTAGVARFTDLSIDTSGTFTLAFDANGLTGDVSDPFTVSSGGGARLAFEVQPVNTVAGKVIAAVKVKVQDAFGNDVPDATDTISLSIGSGPSGATLLGTASAAAVSGVATFSDLAIQKSGTFTLSATSGLLTQATSASFRILADVPVGLAVGTQPANVVAGQPISPAVEIQVLDQYGNVAEQSNDNVVVAIATGPSGATVFGNTNSGPTSGVVTLNNLRLDKVGAYTLTATSGSLTPVTTGSFNVSPAAPAQLVWSAQPANVVAGVTAAAVKVKLQDAFGNDTPTATNPITLAVGSGPQGAVLGGTKTVAAVAGEATFSDLTLDKSGSYSLLATSGTLTSAVSAFFNVAAAGATKLAFTVEPTSAGAGRQLSPALQVTVQDQFGNTVPSATSSVFLAIKTGPNGAVLQGTTTQNANGGVARFADLSINTLGSYTLEASSAGLAAVTSASFDITPGAPAQLAFLTQPTNIVAGEAVTPGVQVQVRDAFGNVTPAQVEVTVALASGPGTATLLGTTSVISSAGVATFPDLSVDKIGGYTLAATAGTLTAATSASFDVTAAAASKLAWVQQPTDEIAGEVISPSISVQLLDQFDNLVTAGDRNVTLAIATQPGGATLGGTATVPSSAGVASFPTVTLDKAGSYTLTASAASVTTITSAAFVISPAAKAQLAFTVQPSNAGAGDAIAPPIRVSVQDQFGNTVPTATDSVTLARATGRSDVTISGTTTVAAFNGVAVFNDIVLDKRDTYTLSASATGLTGTTSSAFTITWGSLKRLVFDVQPSNVVAGVSIAPAVSIQVQDLFGNDVDDATDSITISVLTGPPGANLTGTTVKSASGGVASFNDLKLDKAGSYTLSAAAGVVNPGTSTSFTVSPAAAAKVGFVAMPSAATAGAALSPQVQVAIQDQFGNTVSSASGDVTVSVATGVNGATFGGTLTRTTASGVASFNDLTLDLAGPYTLGAASTGLTSGTSTIVTVGHAAKSKLAFSVPPSTVKSGDAIVPAVQVTIQDAFGNTVLNATDNVSLAIDTAPGGGAIGGTSTVAAVSGVATFSNVTLNKKGTYTLEATSGALTPVTSSSFTVNNNNAFKLAFSVQPSNATAGVAVAPTIEVQLLDQNDNVVSEGTNSVTLSVASGPGALSGTATRSAVAGVASFDNISFETAGSYTLTASSGSLNAATSASFTIAPAAAAKLALTAAPTSGTAGVALTPALQVAIQDAFGNAVSATDTVAVAIKTGTGTLSGTASLAATAGVASFSTLSIDKSGAFTLEATSGSLDPVTTGTITINHAAPSSIAFTQQPSNTTAGSNVSPAITLTVSDAFGNVATSYTSAVDLAVTGGGATVSGTSSVNAVAGVATFSALQVNKAGSWTLTATSGSLTSSPSSSFTIAPAAASTLAFTGQPSNATAGVAIAPALTVEIRDAFGNLIDTATSTVTLGIGAGSPAGSTLGGTTAQAAVAGVATFSDLEIEKAGTGYTLQATAASLSSATSSSFDIAPAAASALAFSVQPSNSAPDEVIAPAVKVQILDAFGNLTASTANVTIAIGTNPGTGVLGGTLTQGAAAGVATFDDLAIDDEGTGYTLAASSAGLTGATSATFNIAAFRIGSFTANKSAYAEAEAGTLSWTTTGVPVGGLVLDPGASSVTGQSSSAFTPFPNTSTSTAWYRLAEAGATYRAELEWTAKAGGLNSETVRGIAARTDGGFYAVGVFGSGSNATATFGGTTLTTAGSSDIWIARYNANGTLAWAESAGGTGADDANAVAVLSDGSVVVVGSCESSAVFDDGETSEVTLSCAGTKDGFVARYGADGTLAWAKKLGGTGADLVNAVAASPTGVVVAGTYSGTATFGAGEQHENTLISANTTDAFVADFDLTGEFQWAESIGGTLATVGPTSITTRGSDIYVVGGFTETATFGAGEGAETSLVSAGSMDVFIARFASTGLLTWAKRAGGTGLDTAGSLVSVSGGIALAGQFSGTATFGVGELTPTVLNAAGGTDAFVAAFDTAGAHQFAKRLGGSSADAAYGIAVQPDGSLVVTGQFEGNATFGPSETNQTVLASAGDADVFIASFTSAGLLQWAEGAGGTGLDAGRRVATLADGSMLTTGHFTTSALFGAGEPNQTTVTGDGWDVFFLKYKPANYRFVQVTRTP